MSEPPDFESEPQHSPLSTDAPDDAESPSTELEDLLARRAPTRLRLAQAGALLLVLVILAGIIFHNAIFAPTYPQANIGTPTAVPNGPIVLLSNVSTGTVTLNGKQLTGSPPLITTFRRGVNTITLSVPPFAARTCHITWPSRQNDGNCDLQPSSGVPQSVDGQIVSPTLLLILPLDLQALPASIQTQALAAADHTHASIAPRITVPVGEYIATGQAGNGDTLSQRTTQPFQATLLATATDLDYFGDAFLDNTDTSPGQLAWRVAVAINLNWLFASNSGEIIESPPWSSQLPETVVITYDKQHGWAIDQTTTQQDAGYGLADGILQDMCNVQIDALNAVANQQNDYVVSRNNQLQGCEFDLQTQQSAIVGRFILRFGVLLAVDAQTHALLPSIPLAPATALSAFND